MQRGSCPKMLSRAAPVSWSGSLTNFSATIFGVDKQQPDGRLTRMDTKTGEDKLTLGQWTEKLHLIARHLQHPASLCLIGSAAGMFAQQDRKSVYLDLPLADALGKNRGKAPEAQP